MLDRVLGQLTRRVAIPPVAKQIKSPDTDPRLGHATDDGARLDALAEGKAVGEDGEG
jgi:hypothetical protein